MSGLWTKALPSYLAPSAVGITTGEHWSGTCGKGGGWESEIWICWFASEKAYFEIRYCAVQIKGNRCIYTKLCRAQYLISKYSIKSS